MWYVKYHSMKRCWWILGVLLLATAPARAALVSHYTMDGTAVDAKGVQDGVLNGGPATVSGKIGQAISFNAGVGVNSRAQNMTVADPAGDEHRPENITVSAWVKTTDDGGWRGVFDKLQTNYGIGLNVNNAYAIFLMGDGSYYDGVGGFPVSTTPVDDGVWHLLTGTFDTESGNVGPAKLYVDGILQDTKTNQYTGNATPLNIAGDIPVSSTYGIDGVLDDVGLWNSVLSDAEARALYTLADDATLNYGLGYAQDLFDVHNAGPGASADVAGRAWYYTAGLGGGLGELVEAGGEYYLQLDACGSGVTTVPEPSTMALMLMSMVSLLAIRVWGKKKVL